MDANLVEQNTEIVPEVAAVEVAEQPLSSREKVLAMLQARHPDTDYSDEEAIWRDIEADELDMQSRLDKHAEIDRALTERFDADPTFGAFFLDALRGKSPVVAMIEIYGEDIRTYLDDPAMMEELAAKHTEYLARVKQENDLETKYNENLEVSLRVADEVQQLGGYTDEQMNAAFTAILDDTTRAVQGEITADMLEMKLKGMNYDVDVAEAEQIGEVRGKNTNIVAKKKALQGSADVPPMIEGKSGGVSAVPPQEDSRLARLREIASSQDIWADARRR